MGIIIGAIKIIIVLGTLITIHELGHFLVAKACKVKVLKFAIGFGPKIFTKQGKETEYTIRLIPFGGFVQLEGEEERSEDKNAFNKKPVYQRILIVAAGATVNILFALFIFLIISLVNGRYYGNIISSINTNSLAYEAGLRSGDIVTKINGKNVLVEYDITDVIEESKNDNFIFTVERNNSKQDINVNIPYTKKGLLGIMYDINCCIVDIVDGTPAATSDLHSGDIIVAVNGNEIVNYEEIAESISKLPESEVKLSVKRNNEIYDIELMTMSVSGRFFDVTFDIIEPKGINAIIYAFNQTGDYFNATIEGMLSLFKGKTENVKVMGPVGVADQIASTEGAIDFFYLMSAISLSLGIFNLLPVPALDGGKILLLIIEKIRKKPFEQETEAVATLVGFSLIIILALVVTVTDVIGIFK